MNIYIHIYYLYTYTYTPRYRSGASNMWLRALRALCVHFQSAQHRQVDTQDPAPNFSKVSSIFIHTPEHIFMAFVPFWDKWTCSAGQRPVDCCTLFNLF